ncbi:MAG TPA: ABC transporter substrate-binding protein [Steroidobacteraceae bacterium]|nr:ABC transporter substrate-binding protein [Steroidobacteraceae bacterium]
MRITKLLLLLLSALAVGCSSKDEDQRIVLGFSQIGSQGAWRLANTESIKSAAATSNIDLRFSDAQQKQENQIAALRQFIADKVDAIAFAPVVATGWEPVLKEAKAAGIPVILTDRTVSADASLYAGFLGSDSVEEGRKAARWVVSRFADDDTPVNIIELEGTVGAAPASDRKKGFEEIIAQHPNLKILHSEPAGFERAQGETVMARLLAAEKRKIHVLFAHNDDMALGAIQAIEAAGLHPGKDILIVSIDAVHAAFEAMIAGKLNASVECNPLLGPQLMTSVTEVVSGRPISKRIIVDEAVFTQDNARQFIQTRKY